MYRSPSQCLSKRFLNWSRDSDSITAWGSEFQSFTVLWLNDPFLTFSLLLRLKSFFLWPLVFDFFLNSKMLLGSILSMPVTILYTWIMSPRRRLCCSDGNFSSLSLSPYSKWLTLFTSFVALRCTFSISFWSSLNLGFQMTFPYSSSGLTRAV